MAQDEQFSEAELIAQAQAGALAAFEELVYRYEARVYRFVLYSCRSPEDALELTQDTFVRAFQALATFRTGEAFAPWLFTIARRKCIDRYRSAWNRVPEPLPEMTGGSDPGEELAMREDRQNIWATARAVLSSMQFQALWLHYAEDMPVEQVARGLGKSRTHAKVLLFRARQKLGRKLELDRGGTVLKRVAERSPGPLPLGRTAQSH
jgi:RNA polymerase sigma-70 factor, ECF subfamily